MSAEQAHESASPTKLVDDELMMLPGSDVSWYDGSPIDSYDEGGVLRVENGQGPSYYHLARTDRVAAMDPDSEPQHGPEDNKQGAFAFLKRRLGRFSLREGKEITDEPTTGTEYELVTINPETGLRTPSGRTDETYDFQIEFGSTPVSGNPDTREAHRGMVTETAAWADERGFVASPVTVFNGEPLKSELTDHPYFLYTGAQMSQRTGFETYETFRMGSVQLHTEGANSYDMIRANSAMQLLVPILTSASMAGPFMHGGTAERLGDPAEWQKLDDKQREHLRQADLRPDDFTGKHASFRPALRALSSPEANVHDRPAPDSLEDYLAVAHQRLQDGLTNNGDRAFGMHRDRNRLVLDQKGANTSEAVNYDTFNGNHEVAAEVHILHAALARKFEAMSKQGSDPFAFVADKLGLGGMDPEAALKQANDLYLHQTARHGNDAIVYGRKPGEWIADLQKLTDLHIDPKNREILGNAYLPDGLAIASLQKWVRNNGSELRAGEAYYATNAGSPSVAMHAERQELHARGIHTSEPLALTQLQDLRLGQDYTRRGLKLAELTS